MVQALACDQHRGVRGALLVQWDSALLWRGAVKGLFFTGALAYS